MPVFIGFAFFEGHGFFTDSADWLVGHSDLVKEDSPRVINCLNQGLFSSAQAKTQEYVANAVVALDSVKNNEEEIWRTRACQKLPAR